MARRHGTSRGVMVLSCRHGKDGAPDVREAIARMPKSYLPILALLCIAPLAICAYAWMAAPDVMVMQVGPDRDPSRMGSKAEMFVLGVLASAANVACALCCAHADALDRMGLFSWPGEGEGKVRQARIGIMLVRRFAMRS